MVLSHFIIFMGSQSSGSISSGNKIDISTLNLLASEKRLTEMCRCLSPVNKSPIFKHLQIILTVESILFVRVSFGNHGTQVNQNINRDLLLNQRQDNMIIEARRININSRRVYQFIINSINDSYHCVFWNCWCYGDKLWEHLQKSPPFD